MTALRSYILLGGHDPQALETALRSDADLILFDFEDMVPEGAKAKARLRVRTWLETEDLSSKAVGVRLNPWLSGPDRIDRTALAGIQIDHVLLPKIESVADLEGNKKAIAEANLGSPALHVIIETPLALESVDDIASEKPMSLFVGAFDLSKALGIEPDSNSKPILQARRRIADSAKKAGVAAFDMPFIDLADASGFEEHLAQSMYLGFTGCAAMTADQADRINAAFDAA